MLGNSEIELLIPSRQREIEPGFEVGRVLPAPARRHVGPFVFLDEMGPVVVERGHGLDVRPHPHIGLATVTYLFEGEILHRDSLGSSQVISPGAVNWMTAGLGIVHSERTPPEARARGSRMHGLQLWVGLPSSVESGAPSFRHYAAESLPEIRRGGVILRVLAGMWEKESPVETASPLFCVDAVLAAGAELEVQSGHSERAVYVVEGEVSIGATRVPRGTLAVLASDGHPVIHADAAARVMLLGGEPLDGRRYIWWNFVSSSQERIIEAARDWKAGSFPKVPGDEVEFVPLVQDPSFPQH